MSIVMDVLDRHVQLAMWAEHPSAEGFWEGYLKFQLTNGYDSFLADQTAPESKAAEGYADSVAHMMGLAETFYVTPDICDVIEESCGTIPMEPLRRHMVPCRIGWIEFAREMFIGVDEHDEPWGINGFSWRIEDELTGLDGVAPGIKWWDKDENEHISPGITIVWWRDISHLNVGADYLAGLPWAAPGQLTGWAFDIPWQPEDRSKYTLDETGELQRKIQLTTFNLLMDEIVKVKKQRPKRAALRRASKVLKGPEYGDVNVIDLRKIRVINYEPPEVDEDAPPVHWTHRWIVQGHWRTLHRNTNKERHVWVRKHVKGPDHMPIVVKDRLHLLKR